MSISNPHSPEYSFADLLTDDTRQSLYKQLSCLVTGYEPFTDAHHKLSLNAALPLNSIWLEEMTLRWQALHTPNAIPICQNNPAASDDALREQQLTDWLIELFNTIFAPQNTILVRGDHEPEYFPATIDTPAQIVFAHGFFASALHEISHWCIAGRQRRMLADYGYWYAADGRNEAQQHAFEQVEIKPQALECLFTLACQRPFRVSQDNLFADFDTSQSTFPQDVHQQAQRYINAPTTLPRDAQHLLAVLLTVWS